MSSGPTLISIGTRNFRLTHLLIIGILILSFSISFSLRMIPGYFGWELNEFDPFFNYRATQYIVENGIQEYFTWNDELSWYPNGRNIASSSQTALHLLTAYSYSLFGFGLDLYSFTIIFPVIVGSLTCFVIFGMVRIISGTTAGLIASLFYAVSIPIILRGTLGWFKSEPLGIFLGLLGLYLFYSGINSPNWKISIIKLTTSGLVTVFGMSSWGGNQFFMAVLGIFILSLPLLRSNKKFLIWQIPLVGTIIILQSFLFERLYKNFLDSGAVWLIVIPVIISVITLIIQRKSVNQYKIRNGVLFISISVLLLILSIIFLPDLFLVDNTATRYIKAVNPFFASSDSLTSSISEHSLITTQTSFFFHSVLMIFSGIGIWILLSKNKLKIDHDKIGFLLIFTSIGILLGSSFGRLEVIVSLALIFSSSIGFYILLQGNFIKNSSKIIKYLFIFGLCLTIIFSIVPFSEKNIFSTLFYPPTILNGGSIYTGSSNDWKQSLDWLKNNTPKDSVIASWWDYGYWIQTLSERATLADNSTINSKVIKKIAEIFFMNPNDAWIEFNKLEADYILFFVAGERFFGNSVDNEPLYTIGGGGDESKKYWFVKIADLPMNDYLYSDMVSATPNFWKNTLLGNSIPFEVIGYVNLQTQEQSLDYKPGFTAVYSQKIKFDDSAPFKLVYMSDGFNVEPGYPFIGIIIFELNDDYIPS